MSEAVRCGRCGILYHSRYEKCPRCRGRDPRPVTLEAAARRVVRPASSRVPRGRGDQAAARPVRPPGARQRGAAAGRPGPADSAAVRLAKKGGLAGSVFAVAASAVILLLTGTVWGPPSSQNASASPPPASSGALAALVRAGQPRNVAVVRQVPRELPFLDPATEGRVAYSGGELEQALRKFEEQIASLPSDAASHSNAGQILVRLGRPADALPFLQKAVALDENRWAYRFNLARCQALIGNWQQAAAEYQAADGLFPNDYATLFNLAQALHRAGQEEAAVERYRQAIAQKADDPSFYLALGTSEERLDHAAEAAAAYRQFLALSPDATEAPAVRERADSLEAAAAGASAATAAGSSQQVR
ncbi:MAG TPA: tetratricopeptide repeat protein [Vicinamibacterales bacterium]|nr:tetratricopeptide repeat protein [Vicinamibacterales bacterium]